MQSTIVHMLLRNAISGLCLSSSSPAACTLQARRSAPPSNASFCSYNAQVATLQARHEQAHMLRATPVRLRVRVQTASVLQALPAAHCTALQVQARFSDALQPASADHSLAQMHAPHSIPAEATPAHAHCAVHAPACLATSALASSRFLRDWQTRA